MNCLYALLFNAMLINFIMFFMKIAYIILLREFAFIPESDKALHVVWVSQVVLVIKIVPASAGDAGDSGSILRLGRSSGGGHGNPIQYSCLESLMDRGA